MRKIITMVLYNRPAYTRTVLEGLRRCHGISDYLILPHLEPGNEEVLELARGIDFAEVRLTMNPQRLGITRNTWQAWEHGFRHSDFIVHLEDDTLPAPDCLRYLEHCRRAFRNDHRIFSAAAYHRHRCAPENYFSIATRSAYTCWLLGLWRDRWDWIRRRWSPIPDLYAEHIEREMKEHGLREVYPLLSRSQNIGALGGYHPVTLAWHRRHHHVEQWAGNVRLQPRRFRKVDDPLVTALFVADAQKDGIAARKRAFADFRKQTFTNKEMVVITRGHEPIGIPSDPCIREILVPPQSRVHISDLLNFGLEEARGDWIALWGKRRQAPDHIAKQIAARRANGTVGWKEGSGTVETALFPRTPNAAFARCSHPPGFAFSTRPDRTEPALPARSLSRGPKPIPRLRRLVLVPQGGLCNRLRAIASARRLCASLDAECLIVWDWGRFTRFFMPLSGARICSSPARKPDAVIEHWPQHVDPARTVDVALAEVEVHSGYCFWGSHEPAITLADLRAWLPALSAKLEKRIDRFAPKVKDAVGFHIRSTDNMMSSRHSPPELFHRKAATLVARGKKIFLATDALPIEREMKRRFGNAIITFPKQEQLAIRWPRTPDARAIEDDLADLFLLGRTEYVIGSYWSSYSETAMLLNGSNRCAILKRRTP